LAYASFDKTELEQTDFGNSDLTGTQFFNVNLTTTILTPEQIQQAIFVNATLPNSTFIGQTTIIGRMRTLRTSSGHVLDTCQLFFFILFMHY
jgi:uncharacterized protein YjbI with pentapeptide repeats